MGPRHGAALENPRRERAALHPGQLLSTPTSSSLLGRAGHLRPPSPALVLTLPVPELIFKKNPETRHRDTSCKVQVEKPSACPSQGRPAPRGFHQGRYEAARASPASLGEDSTCSFQNFPAAETSLKTDASQPVSRLSLTQRCFCSSDTITQCLHNKFALASGERRSFGMARRRPNVLC